MKRQIGITLALLAGLGLGVAPALNDAAAAQDLGKMELMLHGLIAVHASIVIDMNAHVAGALKADDATAEIARNTKFLEVLSKACTELERKVPLGEHDQMSFIKDYKQVCDYLELALDSFSTYLAGGNELDRKLTDRYILRAEKATSRLLKGLAGD